ncbi:MAG: hypothetical protein ACFE7R_03705 [Candidatus Hodarchaeota archaeon]
MSNKNASKDALTEDLRVSFKFAFKNVLSFLLGMIGVILVSVLVMGIGFGLFMIPLYFALGGWVGITTYFDALGVFLNALFNTGALFSPFGILLILSTVTIILSPFFIAMGALFGMGREVVESSGTSAEGVFTWYRKKFFSLAGGGILLFFITVTPLILVWGVVSFGFTVNITGLPAAALSALSATWILLSLGLMSMLFPAIIDNLSVIEAAKTSIRLSTKHFDRVFALWLSLVGILTLVIIPLFVFIPFDAPESVLALLAVYAIPAVFFLLLIWIPALVIALSRLYMILSGIEISVAEKTEPDVSLVGGM